MRFVTVVKQAEHYSFIYGFIFALLLFVIFLSSVNFIEKTKFENKPQIYVEYLL